MHEQWDTEEGPLLVDWDSQKCKYMICPHEKINLDIPETSKGDSPLKAFPLESNRTTLNECNVSNFPLDVPKAQSSCPSNKENRESILNVPSSFHLDGYLEKRHISTKTKIRMMQMKKYIDETKECTYTPKISECSSRIGKRSKNHYMEPLATKNKIPIHSRR